MILSDKMIKAAIEAGDIVIDPFDLKALGTNSYDVHLGPVLMTYSLGALEIYSTVEAAAVGQINRIRSIDGLDCRVEQTIRRHVIDEGGFVLYPGMLYLGSTLEYTETHKHVPFIDGKSSLGRLGVFIHCTAGRGDVGFKNHFTLEITVVHPVRVYAGMPIGQLIYFETGDVDVPYGKKAGAKYNERCADPQPSQMWRNFK